MKQIVLIALVLLVMVGCDSQSPYTESIEGFYYTKETAAFKAQGLVQEDCVASPEYSWHRLPITAYDARLDKSEEMWNVDLGSTKGVVTVVDRGGNSIGLVGWGGWNNTDSQDERVREAFLEHCGPNLPKGLR